MFRQNDERLLTFTTMLTISPHQNGSWWRGIPRGLGSLKVEEKFKILLQLLSIYENCKNNYTKI